MSLDYGTGKLAASGTLLHGSIVNGTYDPSKFVWSKDFDFLVLMANIRIRAAATTASGNSLQVQLSAADGTFTVNTVLLTVPIVSTNLAAAQLSGRVPDNLALVTHNGTRCVRIVHVAGATDATLDYDWEVYTTSRHE
jgi:hypothetical protein